MSEGRAWGTSPEICRSMATADRVICPEVCRYVATADRVTSEVCGNVPTADCVPGSECGALLLRSTGVWPLQTVSQDVFVFSVMHEM